MNKYLFFAAALFSLTACNSSEEPAADGPIPIKVTATIGAESRAANTSWDKGDKIGITTLREGEEKYVNMEYTTANGDGKFTGTDMFFQDKTVPVTFTAYYPFTGTEGTAPGKIEVSTAAENQTAEKQPGFDFLWDQQTNIKGEKHTVGFNFEHKMNKLTLIFKNGTGAHVSNINSYIISGLKMDGTFDPATGVAEVKSDATAKDLEMTVESVASEVAVPSLILIPQSTSSTPVTLKIPTANGTYGCTLSFAGGGMAAGNEYRFTITVNRTGLEVETSTIQNWALKGITGEAVLQ